MRNKRKVRFNFDISTFRLIGRELITDKITALVELVKNAYDANAENVSVEFYSTDQITTDSKIIITDDGKGMSSDDILEKWMIIGTPDKRENRISDAPYNRIYAGKKGIGRFAVDKLGAVLILETTKKNDEEIHVLENDWRLFEDIEAEQIRKNKILNSTKLNTVMKERFFTDVENDFWEKEKTEPLHGTILKISDLREIWTEPDIARVYKELSKLISPNYKPKYPFNITIIAPGFKNYEYKKVESFAFEETATYKCVLKFNEQTYEQEILYFNKTTGKLKNKLVPGRCCGLLEVHLYYFDQDAKKKFKSVYSNGNIDGIKIYRDGILTTPFAENVDQIDGKKDLLGIDKRRYSGFFDRISNRDLLGWIELSDTRNPDIIEATNRQGFLDNDAWKELKAYIIEQLSSIERMLKFEKDIQKEKVNKEIEESKSSFSEIKKLINTTESNDGKVNNNLLQIKKELRKLQGAFSKSQSQIIKAEKEKERVEDLLFSLVSVQTFAGMLSHIVRTLIMKIKDRVEFLHKRIPDPKYNDLYKEYALDIFNEMNSLDKSVNFLLRYSKESDSLEDIDVILVIEHLINDIYINKLREKNIKTEILYATKIIIRYNRKALEDILDNLISNTFKALYNVKGIRLLKILIKDNKNSLVIHFSNNGPCIPVADKNRIFDVFYTTTANQGGAGLGLYIVKKRLETVNGSIEVIENEFKPNGATFELIIPYKRSCNK
jgi:signal transduction histidine kinase